MRLRDPVKGPRHIKAIDYKAAPRSARLIGWLRKSTRQQEDEREWGKPCSLGLGTAKDKGKSKLQILHNIFITLEKTGLCSGAQN